MLHFMVSGMSLLNVSLLILSEDLKPMHKNRRLNYLKGSSENNPIHQAIIIVTESRDKKADMNQI